MFTENNPNQNQENLNNQENLTSAQQEVQELLNGLTPEQAQAFLDNKENLESLLKKQEQVGKGEASFNQEEAEPKTEEAVEEDKETSKKSLVNKWTAGGASLLTVAAAAMALTFGSGSPESVNVNADGEGAKVENVEATNSEFHIDSRTTDRVYRGVRYEQKKFFEEYSIGTSTKDIEERIENGEVWDLLEKNHKQVFDDLRSNSGLETQERITQLRQEFVAADKNDDWQKRYEIATEVAVLKELLSIPTNDSYIVDGYNFRV